MANYIDHRMLGIGEKPRTVIVDGTGKIVNKNPSKEELKGLKTFPEEKYNYNAHRCKKFTDGELDYHLIRFFVENGRPPSLKDFTNNSEYPSFATYQRRFGSWANALERVGLDVESMVKNGIIETEDQKGRFGEIIIRDHFKKHPIDLAGENKNSPYDGICPNGLKYDVKGSKLYIEGYLAFGTSNIYKDKIEIYYLLAFNEGYTELIYAWRIPARKVVDRDGFKIGLKSNYKFNIENMKEYDITDNIRDALKKYGFFNKSKKLSKKYVGY